MSLNKSILMTLSMAQENLQDINCRLGFVRDLGGLHLYSLKSKA